MRVEAGPYHGRVIKVLPGESLRVGRSIQVAEPFPRDSRMSRNHFEIKEEDGRFILSDAGSKNGTKVNGERCRRATLADGDTVQAGRSQFSVTVGHRDIFDREQWLADRRSAMIATRKSIGSSTICERVAIPEESHSSAGSNGSDSPAETMVLASGVASERRPNLRLKVIAGPHEGEDFELAQGTFLRVGSGPNVDLSLDRDPAVAAVHCTVFLTPTGTCRVEGFESDASMLLDGQRVTECNWETGSRLQIGGSVLIR